MEESKILEKIRKLPSGDIAALRRMAGKPLQDASGEALRAVFRMIPHSEQNERSLACWLTVLSIVCLWHPNDAKMGGSIPAMMKRYQKEKGYDGNAPMDAKLQLLLDIRWEEDGYFSSKLADVARILRSNDPTVIPNPELLLNDIEYWNSNNKNVQIRWAKEFYLEGEE